MTSATDNRTTELLPCPFCGGEARIFELRFGTGWRVLCSKSFCAQGPDGATEAEAIVAWNTRTHGTLTAEQVREAVEASTWAETSTIREFNDSSWQAIADELNAERHVETCRITASSTDGLCSDNPRHYFELSCGHSFTINGLDAPVACAVCGKVVKNAD